MIEKESKEIEELRKSFEETEKKIHELRKLGMDMRISARYYLLSRGKYSYARASSHPQDIIRAQQALDDVHKQMKLAEQEFTDHQHEEEQKTVSFMKNMLQNGIQLLSSKKVTHARFLYTQISRRYEHLPKPLQKQLVHDILNFRTTLQNYMKESSHQEQQEVAHSVGEIDQSTSASAPQTTQQ